MQKSRHSSSLALLLAAASLAAVGVAQVPTARAQTEASSSATPVKAAKGLAPTAATRRASTFVDGGISGSRGWQRRHGPGWTQAHVKRMAHKRRNVARNRKAHR